MIPLGSNHLALKQEHQWNFLPGSAIINLGTPQRLLVVSFPKHKAQSHVISMFERKIERLKMLLIYSNDPWLFDLFGRVTSSYYSFRRLGALASLRLRWERTAAEQLTDGWGFKMLKHHPGGAGFRIHSITGYRLLAEWFLMGEFFVTIMDN